MRVIATPQRLKKWVQLFFLVLPLGVFASLVSRGMHWWQIDYTQEWKPLTFATSVVIVLAWGLSRASRIAFYSALLLTLFGLGALFYISWRQESVGLGLLSIAYSLTALGFFDRLYSAMSSPSLNPGLSWFQSVPEPIPGLSADWGEFRGLRLSRLDRSGGFILWEGKSEDRKNLPHQILLRYRGSQAACSTGLVSLLESKKNSVIRGVGVEFKNIDRDSQKELSDFVEILRGEGHVITEE